MKYRFLRKKTQQKAQEIQKETYDPFKDFQGSKVELFLAKFFYYLRNNIKIVLTALIIFTVLLASFVFYHVYSENLEERSLKAYEELLKNPLLRPGAGDLQAAIEKLDAYEKEYGTRNTKKRVLLKKIELYEHQKEYEQAAIHYEELAKLYEYPELKQYAHYKAAIYFENSKKYSRALANIDELLKHFLNNDILMADVLFTQVRLLYHLGKKEDMFRIAKKLLEMDTANREVQDYQLQVLSYLLIKNERNE